MPALPMPDTRPHAAPRPHGAFVLALVVTLALGFVTGCASPPTPAPVVPASPLQQAANRLTDAVLGQALRQRGAPPAFGTWPAQSVEVAPVLDARERKPSAAGEQATRWIVERMARQHPAFVVREASGPPARWRLEGSLTAEGDSAGGGHHPHVLALALVDATTGDVAASARERVIDPLLDASFEASQRVRATPPPAPTPAKPAAEASKSVDPMQALRDEYLALLQQGREADAQAVFGRMMALGLARRDVPMKLLFATGSTRFWPDPQLARRYPGWLAELARQVRASPLCLRIVGHASRAGNEDYNRQLSLRRAQTVRAIMLRSEPDIASKLAVAGMGESETVVGNEGDDQRNAADRRVEFEVVDCPPKQ